jgi:hypothetical protein
MPFEPFTFLYCACRGHVGRERNNLAAWRMNSTALHLVDELVVLTVEVTHHALLRLGPVDK